MGLYGSWHDAGALEYCESSVKADGTINSDSTPTVKVLRGDYLDQTFKDYDWEPHIGYLYKGDSNKITYCINYQDDWSWADDCSHYDDVDKTSVSRSGKWHTVSTTLSQRIALLFKTQAKDYYDDPNNAVLVDLSNGLYIRYNGAIDGSSGSATANSAFEYKITNVLTSFKKAYKNIWNEDFSSNKFSKSQQAGLYQNYVLSYWGAETEACADTKAASTEAGKDLVLGIDTDGYYHQTKLYKSDGSAQYCYAKTEKWGNQVYGITDSQVPSDTEIGFAAVTKWLLDNGPDEIDPEDMATSLSDGENSEDDENGKVEQTCMNSGGAGSLGWIVCSLLDWMGDATEGLYNNIVKPALTVNVSFFEDSATREAWEKFRDIANILFIIMVLFVVFSQLTGVGIDNYGIKKILPKLIVVAILVNLSFLICVICVDLSNILGNGFQAFLDGLGTSADTVTISVSGGPSGADSGSVNIAMDAGIISVGVIAAAISVYAIYSNPAILLTLLIGAIGVMIAILFVFILLAGRKAVIVLLAVLSPVAFILYLLPNTKKIFDKWLKIWEAMLFLYPICGLLIGGGNFASKLMLNVGGGDGIATVLTALVIGIIPIFFIPTVLKGAFAAMGTMGNAISGFGNRMRGGATKGLRNSRAYKNAQERGQESGIRRKAGYDSKGNRKWDEDGPNWRQRLLRGGKRSIARNALAYQKLQSEKGALAATEGADFMLETETANEAKRIVSSGEINDMARLQQGLYDSLRTNNRAGIRAYSDALFSKKEEGNKSAKAAYNDAVRAGASQEAMQTWANNVMQNHAGLKKDHGSLFAAAQGIVGGGAAQSTGDYLSTADPTTGLTGQAALAGKVSKTSIGSMDDASFEEIFGGYNSNNPVSIPTGADAQAIGETAYNAIRENPDMNSKRLGYLRQLVAASGYSPDTQTVQFGAGSQEMNALSQTAANTGRTANGVDAVNAQLQQIHQLSGAQLDAKMAQLDDQTIGEIASDPQLSNNDPIVQAAQREYTRRDRERGPQFDPQRKYFGSLARASDGSINPSPHTGAELIQ